MRDQYMRTGQGFLLVFSLTTRASFDEVASLRDHILEVKDLDKVPLVLVGNKSDLVNLIQVPPQEASMLATSFGVPFLATSAKDRVNVDECFFELVREMRYAAINAQGDKPGAVKKRGKCLIL